MIMNTAVNNPQSKIMNGNYQILQKIGAGSYGVIYKARRISNQITIIIKYR